MKRYVFQIFAVVLMIAAAGVAHAADPALSLNLGGTGAQEMSSAVKIILLVTLLSIAPAILITMTSFTRIVIVFSFIRQAIGVAQSPPNQVLVGLALFLTLFIMGPVIKQVNDSAIAPFRAGAIDQNVAIERGMEPIRRFMYSQTRESDINLMLKLSHSETPQSFAELSNLVLIPAYILSELNTAFEIGFLIYIPFVLIDMLISMILLTMGMMVLPPVMISLPFKLMLFVMVDGWDLIVGSLVRSFS